MNRAISFMSASLLVAFGVALLSSEAEAGRRRHRNCCQPAVYSGCSGYQQYQSYFTSAGGCNSQYGACNSQYGGCNSGACGGNVTYGTPMGATYQQTYQHTAGYAPIQQTAGYAPAAIAGCAPQASPGTYATGSAPIDSPPPQPSVVDGPNTVPAPGN